MEYHNLDRLVDLIRERDFKVVSIQCSDTNESVRLCDHLQELFPRESGRNFYILGDVLTGSCCLDIIATKRLNAVYIGESCFFDLETAYYVFHLYPKLAFDLDRVSLRAGELCGSPGFCHVLLVYRTGFHHALDDLVDCFLKHTRKLSVALCPDSEAPSEPGQCVSRFCNRPVWEFCREDGGLAKRPATGLGGVDAVVYLNESEDDTLLKSIALESTCPKLYELRASKDGCTALDRAEMAENIRMKRYLAVERAKEAEHFAVVTLTKSFKNGNELRRTLQDLLVKRKKKCTLMCINHLTEAKLRNFPRVDTWVLLSCNLTHLSLERELEKLVVFPYELLVALGVLSWAEDPYVYDFGRLRAVVEEYLAVNYPKEEEDEASGSGELRTATKMELSQRFEDLYEGISANAERVFRGVDPDHNFDKTPTVVKGFSGTPASYSHEREYQ